MHILTDRYPFLGTLLFYLFSMIDAIRYILRYHECNNLKNGNDKMKKQFLLLYKHKGEDWKHKTFKSDNSNAKQTRSYMKDR